MFTVVALREGTPLQIPLPGYQEYVHKNEYAFWDIRAPHELKILITFDEVDMENTWDGLSHLYFGDEATNFTYIKKSCYPWTRLTDENGIFINKYRQFASASSSVKIIWSSEIKKTTFSISLDTITPIGEYDCIICSFPYTCMYVCMYV